MDRKIKITCLIAFSLSLVQGLAAQAKPQPAPTPVVVIKTGPTKTTTSGSTTNKLPSSVIPCSAAAVTITTGVLNSGSHFRAGSTMWSPNHVYHLYLDPKTGELSLFDNTRLDGQYIHPIWTAGTADQGVACGRMTSKNGFELINFTGKHLWQPLVVYFTSDIVTGASSAIDVSLVLENDGTLHYRNGAGKTVTIYDGADQNKKPEPKYIGDTSFQRWNKGQALKPGTRLYAPDLKAVMVCDETGLYLRAADVNEVSFPTYISTKLKEVTECVFLADGNLAVHQPGYGKGWTTQTQGLGGTYIHVNALKNEIVMVDDKSNPPKTVWTSKKGKQ